MHVFIIPERLPVNRHMMKVGLFIDNNNLHIIPKHEMSSELLFRLLNASQQIVDRQGLNLSIRNILDSQ